MGEKTDWKTPLIVVVAVIVVAIIIWAIIPKNSMVSCEYPEVRIGDSCCIDKNVNNVCDNQETASFNVNDIQMSMEGEKTIDLYLGGEGGPSRKTNFIEIINNNPESITLKVYCDTILNLDNEAHCQPNKENSHVYISGNSKSVVEIPMNVFIAPETRTGYYDASFVVELNKYYDEVKQEYIPKEIILKAFPITINVYDLNG